MEAVTNTETNSTMTASGSAALDTGGTAAVADDSLDDLYYDVAEAAAVVYFHPAWQGNRFDTIPSSKWNKLLREITHYSTGLARWELDDLRREVARKPFPSFGVAFANLMEQIARLTERPELPTGVYNSYGLWENELIDWVIPNDRRRTVWMYRQMAAAAPRAMRVAA